MLTGLDVLITEDFKRLKGRKIGLVCNQASISKSLAYAFDILAPHGLTTLFGPQHGLFGHTQDNMIEWEPSGASNGPRLFSLYGHHREPTAEMLANVELLVIDLQDVGARYYTFIWTMALCMKACENLDIPVMILDRPNPIGGIAVEGTVQQEGFESFVGLYPLPIRHGMTIGEIANHLHRTAFPAVDIEIVKMNGWSRSLYFDCTDVPWAMPSPNMPFVDTAVVYPGGCLLEATNLSEGRGTTRPFEIFGAPYLSARPFADALNAQNLPGCHFRPLEFQPTFNKHAGTVCGGCFLHVTGRASFKPVLTYVAIMQEAIRQSQGAFAWKQPPYEYEFDKLPIDILAGNAWLRLAIENLKSLDTLEEQMHAEAATFAPARTDALLY